MRGNQGLDNSRQTRENRSDHSAASLKPPLFDTDIDFKMIAWLLGIGDHIE
jgi:hypothetical protein